MKHLLLFFLLSCCFTVFSQVISKAQPQKANTTPIQNSLHGADSIFDLQKAYEESRAKGIEPSETEGYVRFLKVDHSSKSALAKQAHKHTPYEQGATGVYEKVIYLNPNQPQNIGCANMGFDQYSFSGWTGGTGGVAAGPVSSGNPVYVPFGNTIVNTAGNNTSVINPSNYHTLMTRPTTTSNIYPTCSSFGYDSVTTQVSGSNLISEIPFVSPYSFDPVSVRMGGALISLKASRLKYVTTTSVNNKQLRYSFACVLDNSAHPAHGSPYFKVEVINEATGTILPGCTSYTFNSTSLLPSDSLKPTATPGYTYSWHYIKYRKWQQYSVDLSSLPLGTNVSVNFEVGGCSAAGHFGYAYVDAECGGIATPYVNMCAGDTYATLVAPPGFTGYQWFDPNNLPVPGATSDTLIVNNPVIGQVYTVQMESYGGCMVSSTVSIVSSSVSIVNLSSSGTCAGGNSGTASVQTIGSNSGYTYVWTSTSGPNTGAIVGTTQIATGLSMGTYSVLVTSPGCGQASASLGVGFSPPQFSTQPHAFCGNSVAIPKPGGTGYQWYHGMIPIPGPPGNNDTLYVSQAINGDSYYVGYTMASGCRDSIQFTLIKTTGGTSSLSNQTNVCPGNTNGSVTLSLNTPFASPYLYTVVSGASTVFSTSTSNTTVAVSSLAAGSYTATVTDGACLYVNTFSIYPIPTAFTVTTTDTILCIPADTAMIHLTYGTDPPRFCGTDSSLCPTGTTPKTLFTSGPFFYNATNTYPSPYAGSHYSGKQQFLVKASDLTAAGISAGKISSLAFHITNMNSSPGTYPDYQIKMGCAEAVSFVSSGTGPSFVTGLQTVYFNPSQAVSSGWLTHQFTQAYLWNGSSDIVVEVCSGGATIRPGSPSFEMKQMSYMTNMRSISGSAGVSSCPDTVGNSKGYLMPNGDYMLPNMRFTNCDYAPPPSSYTVHVSPGSIGQNYGNDSLKIIPPFASLPANNQPVTYTISVVNSNGGCVATQTVAMLYTSSTSNAVSATSSQSTICIGSPVTLTSSGANLYQWFYMQNGSAVPVSTSPAITVTPAVTGTNTYIITGSSACPSVAPDTKTITIQVLPKADLLISPLKNITKCMDRPYVITTGVSSATSGNSGTPYTYSWTVLPGNSPAPGINSASGYTMNANHTATLVVMVNGQCANAATDTVVISSSVNDLSVSILGASPICPDKPVTLKARASGGHPEYTFGWLIDGTPTASSNPDPAFFTSPGAQGEYTVAVYVNDSCGYKAGDFEVIVVLPCHIEIPNVITPNNDASNEFFKIKNIEYYQNVSVTIFDRWGKKVYENPDYHNEWRGEGVSDGTFFYVIDVPNDKRYSGFVTVFIK